MSCHTFSSFPGACSVPKSSRNTARARNYRFLQLCTCFGRLVCSLRELIRTILIRRNTYIIIFKFNLIKSRVKVRLWIGLRVRVRVMFFAYVYYGISSSSSYYYYTVQLYWNGLSPWTTCVSFRTMSNVMSLFLDIGGWHLINNVVFVITNDWQFENRNAVQRLATFVTGVRRRRKTFKRCNGKPDSNKNRI